MRAAGQNDAQTTAACPNAAQVEQKHLLGLWRAEFDGLAQGATLLLEPHGLYAQSVSGTINRDGLRAQLAGDVEDGEFSLEESYDGVSIAATWIGDVVEGSCGREIRGTWQGTADREARTFVMRRIGAR